MYTQKPSLPSIQCLLGNDTIDLPVKRHQKQASMSSLPSELQQLSLKAPATATTSTTITTSTTTAINTHNTMIPEKSENNQPSWMMMHPNHTQKRPYGHARSASDYSLVNPIAIHPPLPPPAAANDQRHRTHRRTMSANTTTINMNSTFFNNTNNSSSSLPYISERALTDSPPNHNSDPFVPQQKQLMDALNISPTVFLSELPQRSPRKEESEEYENLMVARDENTGRYYCPFCNKAFNRPSSLRIHTYSHTGEKPFVCQEEGCGRQFSVQSNMRRHLRVHRLGRSKTNK